MNTDEWLLNKWASVIENVSNAPKMFQDKAAIITPILDMGVDFLRDPMVTPNLSINKLMTLAWRLIGNRITPVAVVEKMPFGHPETLHFWCEIKPEKKLGVVLVPWEWDQMCVDDRFMQLGGLVFTASQCADYYHGKINAASGDQAITRARAIRGRFLNIIRKG